MKLQVDSRLQEITVLNLKGVYGWLLGDIE